jgi:UDP-N-acetylmuramoyl-L-alanyl-D-glutamate--2,6-diaminopimelate ligase
VALPGTRAHGAQYAADAVARGAAGILTDPAGAALLGEVAVPVQVVPDPRAVMAQLAARLYGYPASRLTVFGVTGTTGKTTTVFLTAALLAGLGLAPATIGTMGLRYGGRRWDWDSTTITTPESPDLQKALAALADAGCRSVAMEVSSHALALRRADAIHFAAVGFTNLGADHLDYHGDLESYFDAKARLFEPQRSDHAVTFTDDPAGRRMADLASRRGLEVLTVGRGPADLRITEETPGPDGITRVRLDYRSTTTYHFELSLPGAHNVTDASVAVALVVASGLDPSPGLADMATVRVPGRVQRVDLPGDAPQVYVDFAHTPQAVASTLDALPRGGRRIVVVGAGGDRDATKRGPMGQAAAARADVVVVTDDNPRSEPPAEIRAAVLAGARAAGGADVIDGGDRRSAIRLALGLAGPRDTVAVLGKGHETTQEIAGEFTDFDDAAVVAEEYCREATG